MKTYTNTPGPWEIEQESGNDHEAFVITDTRTDGRTVAWTANTYDPETDEEFISDEDRANAALIAAAPDLLKELEALTEYLITHLPKGNIRDSAHFQALNEHACLVKAARAAIAKARPERTDA